MIAKKGLANVLLAAIVTASFAVVTIIATGNAFAEGGSRGGGQRQGRMMDQLNLTQEQKQRMQEIRKDTQAKMKPLREEMRQANQERKSLLANNASNEQLEANFNKIQDIKNRIARVQFESRTKMRDVLTPEQRAKMDKMMQERKGNWGQRGQRGNGSQNRPQGQNGQWNMDR